LGCGADYQLAPKDNQRSLANEVALFFDAPELRALCPFETIDADHARVETRRHWVSHDVAWLNGDRRAAGEPRFPGLKAIAMVEAIVEQGGETATSRRCFISSLQLDERSLARAVRAHWGIENRLHWVLDVVFHDDQSRLRTKNGPRNMATIKHMALNSISAAPGKGSLKARRKAAAWDHEYLKALIARTAQ
jgi:predicted transposase YbfD/YdcC